jgi:subtilisin-like proprotein convertase family protein
MRKTTRSLLLGAAALAAVAKPAFAQVVLSSLTFQDGVNGVSFQNSGLIPDGNPGGWSDTRQIVTPSNRSIISLSVSLTINGGYNGDLYVYLRAPAGQVSVLLNRVGSTSGNSFGNSDPGMNITLRDDASTDVHLYATVPFTTDGLGRLTGAWQADGRSETVSVTDTSARDASLSKFTGASPDGNWTLFVSDLSLGEEATIKSWGVQMTVVPEPRAWTLASALGLVLFALYLSRRQITG